MAVAAPGATVIGQPRGRRWFPGAGPRLLGVCGCSSCSELVMAGGNDGRQPGPSGLDVAGMIWQNVARLGW
jgi:hypothetical protein